MTYRIAIAQITMHWTTPQNVASICSAMDVAQSQGAQICGFSELAVTGFHRQIAREATPEVVSPALREIQARAGRLSLGVAVGAPTFADGGAKYISHVLIDERGETTAVVPKRGLTDPEATFFTRGSSRSIGNMHGLRCSAVICREVEDLDLVSAELPIGTVDLIFVPGALRQVQKNPEQIRLSTCATSSAWRGPRELTSFRPTGPTPSIDQKRALKVVAALSPILTAMSFFASQVKRPVSAYLRWANAASRGIRSEA